MIQSSALFLALLGGSALALAPDRPDQPERAPYVAYLGELDEAHADGLRGALAKVPGVARVELDIENGFAALHAKDDAYVARANVEKLFATQDVELGSFVEPSWSKVMVYVVTAAGGG